MRWQLIHLLSPEFSQPPLLFSWRTSRCLVQRYSCLGHLVPFSCRWYTSGDQVGYGKIGWKALRPAYSDFFLGGVVREAASRRKTWARQRKDDKEHPMPDSERQWGRRRMERVSRYRSITLLLLLRHRPLPPPPSPVSSFLFSRAHPLAIYIFGLRI